MRRLHSSLSVGHILLTLPKQLVLLESPSLNYFCSHRTYLQTKTPHHPVAFSNYLKLVAMGQDRNPREQASRAYYAPGAYERAALDTAADEPRSARTYDHRRGPPMVDKPFHPTTYSYANHLHRELDRRYRNIAISQGSSTLLS